MTHRTPRGILTAALALHVAHGVTRAEPLQASVPIPPPPAYNSDWNMWYPDFTSTVGYGNLVVCLNFPQLIAPSCVQDEAAQKEEKEQTKVQGEKNIAKLLWWALLEYGKNLVKGLFQEEAELNTRGEIRSSGREDGIAPRAALRQEPSIDIADAQMIQGINMTRLAPSDQGDGVEGVLASQGHDLLRRVEETLKHANAANAALNELGSRTGAVNLVDGLEPATLILPNPGAMPLALNSSPPPASELMFENLAPPGDDPGFMTSAQGPPGTLLGRTDRGEPEEVCRLPEDAKGVLTATEDVRASTMLVGMQMASDMVVTNTKMAITEARATRRVIAASDRALSDWLQRASWTAIAK